MAKTFEAHKHSRAVHNHEHVHITHHCRGGREDDIEHLVASHAHSHNHSRVEHAHGAHKNAEQEHSHEGHIHDHAHATRS